MEECVLRAGLSFQEHPARMSCGMKLLDLRRKRMLCQKFFAVILYLKVVAYTGKYFREDGLSDVAFFLPFSFRKFGGACDLGRDPQNRDCLEGFLLPHRASSIHLTAGFLTAIPTCCVLVLPIPLEWCFLPTYCEGLEKLSFCSGTTTQRALAEQRGRNAQQVPCEPVWSVLQLPLASGWFSFT